MTSTIHTQLSNLYQLLLMLSQAIPTPLSYRLLLIALTHSYSSDLVCPHYEVMSIATPPGPYGIHQRLSHSEGAHHD